MYRFGFQKGASRLYIAICERYFSVNAGWSQRRNARRHHRFLQIFIDAKGGSSIERHVAHHGSEYIRLSNGAHRGE